MAYLIAIVIGVLIGAAGSNAFGALVGGLLGFLLVRVRAQGSEIAALRRRFESALVPSTPTDAAQQATSTSPEVAMPLAEAMPVETSHPQDAVAPFVPAPMDAPLPMPLAAMHAEPAAPPVWTAPSTLPSSARSPSTAARASGPNPLVVLQRWLLGGNTIVKAGVAILFVGLAFLATYAAEHTHLPVEFRLAGIGAVAIGLLGVGWRLRLKRAGYAQVLQGGAIAVLYLTLFAAFRFYSVIDAVPAFITMVAVAAFAAALAVLQDARALAVIGALGGFAAPLLVSTGSNNYVGLFTYYLVLDAGIAAVAWFKTWRSLNLIGFFATFIVATAWGALKYEPAHFANSETFLIAFFLLFVVIMVLPARRAATPSADPALRRLDGWVNSSLLFGLPTVTFALQYGLVRGTDFGTALSALVLAAFYVGLATWMKKRPELGITFAASLAIATVFLTLVIPFALDERSTAGAWALEGAGLVWIGFRQARLLPRGFGYFLLFVSAGAMLLGHQRFGAPTEVFNAYLFNGLLAAAAALGAAYFIARQHARGLLSADERPLEPLLIGLATLWLAATATAELSAFVDGRFIRAAIVVAIAAIGTLYALLSRRLAWPGIAWPMLAMMPLLFMAAGFDAAFLENPVRDGGWWAWPLAFAAHAFVLRSAALHWPPVLRHANHALGAVTLALLGALVGRAATQSWGDASSAWPWLGWLLAPAALLLLLPQPALAKRWPVSACPDAYRDSAAAVIAVGLWFWTVVANVASDGSAAPLPHLPLLNPLDVGIGLALVAILLWLRSVGRLAKWSISMVAAAAFVWLNAMLVRAFHHYGGVPYDFDAWMGSLAVQTGITLLWTAMALAAMWLSARRRVRLPWVTGAALLGAVVLKLLVVDLSGSGSVTRIVSFIGVGMLMLVIGYVAPLPAKEGSSRAAA